jgi:hypothetical protein
MRERANVTDLTRQVLLNGTSCITDETGNKGFKAEIVQAGALIRIAGALEAQTDLLRGAHAGFTLDQQRDGRNHVHMVQRSDSCLVDIKVLGSSPAMAKKLADAIGDALKGMVDTANEMLKEGGPDNG